MIAFDHMVQCNYAGLSASETYKNPKSNYMIYLP